MSTQVVRVHYNPLYLPTPPLDPPGQHRFDDPRGEYVVRYTGSSVRACLLETMAQFRRQDVDATLATVVGIDEDDVEPSPGDGVGDWLDGQMVATFPIDRERVVMEVNDPALLGELDKHPLVRAAIRDSGLGTPLDPQHLDEALIRLSGPIGRRITQAVSRAIYEVHPEAEVVAYRSRHDDTETCYALYHRGSAWKNADVRRLTPAVADDRAAVRSVSSLFEIDLPDRWT